MKSTRFSRSRGHIGTVFTFSTPFGVLGLFAALELNRPMLGLGLLLAACASRIVMALASGWTVVRDRRALGFCWLYPVRDLMGFAFWCASFFGREIVWRDERYRLEHGGRMVACGPGVSILAAPDTEGIPTTVTANHVS